MHNEIKDKQHETLKQDNKQMRDTNEQKAVPNVNAKRVVTKSKKRLNRERIENELKKMTDGPLEESSHSDTVSTSSVGSEHFSDGSDSDSEIADEEAEKCNTADEIHKLMESKRSKKVNTLKFENANANANITSNLNDVSNKSVANVVSNTEIIDCDDFDFESNDNTKILDNIKNINIAETVNNLLINQNKSLFKITEKNNEIFPIDDTNNMKILEQIKKINFNNSNDNDDDMIQNLKQKIMNANNEIKEKSINIKFKED